MARANIFGGTSGTSEKSISLSFKASKQPQSVRDLFEVTAFFMFVAFLTEMIWITSSVSMSDCHESDQFKCPDSIKALEHAELAGKANEVVPFIPTCELFISGVEH